MIASGIDLVMTVIGFAVSTMFIVFVCTRLICSRIQLNASRRSFLIASRSEFSILERGLGGLEPLVVANFPTKKYNEKLFSASEDARCTICLAEYHGEDTLRILPYCGHSFHVNCIDIWLQQHSTCPVCRISLRALREKKQVMQPLSSSAIRGTESFDTNSYNCLLIDHGFSSRTHHNHWMNMNSIQEHHSTSEDVTEGDQVVKYLGNKHVESPSNV